MKIKQILVLSISLLTVTAYTSQLLYAETGHGHDEKAEKSHDDDHGDSHKDDHGDSHKDEHGDSHSDKKGSGHDEEAAVIKFSDAQMSAANIIVAKLDVKAVSDIVTAPGEVALNQYQTVKITPRIDAQVIARHVILGDEVKEGQALVTLSSVAMAEVQGQLLLATREWYRVKKLGRKVVAERRYSEAQANWQQLKTKVSSYGMTDAEIKKLISGDSKNRANGRFQLQAPLAGTVIHDEYIIGERIEPGRVLVMITDESLMWINALLTPKQISQVDVGNSAQIIIGKLKFDAKVIQIHHKMDETTRTQSVRLEVKNFNDQLHAGMFVTAVITSNQNVQALIVPEAAVLRSADGDWQVFVQTDTPGEFTAQEVELTNVINGQAIIAGLAVGTRVVIQGAFFVQSELAKGGFEIHNH